MKIVCITYARSNDIQSPEDWHKRLSIFIGSWEILARRHEVIRIDLLRFNGREKRNGIDYIFFDPGKDKILFPLTLHRKVKSLAPDIVFVAGLHYPFQILQLRILMPASVRIIAQHHAEKPFLGIKKWLQRLADHSINTYFFASTYTAVNWVQQGNIRSLKKVKEIMEVSSVFAQFSPNQEVIRSSSNAPLFLFVGRLNANKDPLIVLRGFLDLIKDHPASKLVFIFQSAELLAAIEKLIDDHKQAVVMLGKIAHGEMASWYQKATYIVSGSQYEGSGTAICEAMSLGCIPILPAIDSFLGMTNNGSCGFLYEPGNEKSLSEIMRLALSADLQEERKKTISQFEKELSFVAIAAKIQAVLDSLNSFKTESA
jgi:glycosyltransferase involved in cell wall biosynthesis